MGGIDLGPPGSFPRPLTRMTNPPRFRIPNPKRFKDYPSHLSRAQAGKDRATMGLDNKATKYQETAYHYDNMMSLATDEEVNLARREYTAKLVV